MKLRAFTAISAVTRKGELKVRPATSNLRFAAPIEGDDALGARMQVLIQTEHGLEMRCFQY
jgi:hypothetical protein